MHNTGVNSFQSVLTRFLPTIPGSPFEFLSDLIGTFFLPQTGHMGVFIIVPIFFVMMVFGGILLLFKKIQFDHEEKKMFLLLSLISLTVFLTYASQIHMLNTDKGMTPDIRYLSPLYFCLSIIGLIILKNCNLLPENMVQNIKEFSGIIIIAVPLSIISLAFAYTLNPIDLKNGNIAFEKFFILYTISIIILTLIVLSYGVYRNCCKPVYSYLILLLCSIPFLWQVNATLVYSSTNGFAKYIFWIPLVRVFWDLVIKYIMLIR